MKNQVKMNKKNSHHMTMMSIKAMMKTQVKMSCHMRMMSTDSGLSTPDRQVFMAASETPVPSGTRPDCYFDDISADELSANAPADETNDDKNARRERNRKRNERRRRLRESLPVRNHERPLTK
jgi:hypothetical protein